MFLDNEIGFSLRETLFTFIVFMLFICLINYNYQRIELYTCGWKLPGPFSYPILGSAYKFLFKQPKDIQPILQQMNKDYGHIFRFWLGPELNVLITKPEYLEKVLTSNCTLQKGDTYRYMQKYLGKGLLASGGTLWKQQRKEISHVFNRKILLGHLDSFNIFSRELIEKLKPCANGNAFNVFHIIADSVHKSICETLLGVEPTEELKEKSTFIHHAEKLYAVAFLRMSKWYFQFDFIFKKSKHYKNHLYVTELLNTFFNYIHSQKYGSEKFQKNPTVALDSIVGPDTSFKQFGESTLTLQTASEESVSTLVSFMLMILGIHKDIQKKLAKELDEVFGDSDRNLEYEDIAKLEYLDLIVKETLRMYPIGTLITRKVEKSFQLTDDLTMPKGAILTLPIYSIHRNADLWDDPNKFIPERFLPENSVNRHPLSFLPFSYGPMNCVGQTYAIWCLKVFASTIFRYYETDCEYKSTDDIELETDISIRPIKGYLVKLYPKKNCSL